MPTPTVTHRTTTRPAVGLTGKGRTVALLITVRERWEQLNPSQQAECSAILERLSVALRRESVPAPGRSRALPLVGRISA